MDEEMFAEDKLLIENRPVVSSFVGATMLQLEEQVFRLPGVKRSYFSLIAKRWHVEVVKEEIEAAKLDPRFATFDVVTYDPHQFVPRNTLA